MVRRLRAHAPQWDRFARWAPGYAWIVLTGFAALLALAAFTARADLMPDAQGEGSAPASAPAAVPASGAAQPERDTDLQLYDRIAERVGAGENYYAVAVEEQRARDFPVRPGLAVRLPTLASVSGWLGNWGMLVLAGALGLAVGFAWWRRLGEEQGGAEMRLYAMLLLAIGALAGFKPHYLALHEVWAGMLLALALGLHRPGKWRGALIAAALALAVRELALPFVLLLSAQAFVRGDRREARAWGVLALLFAIGLALHLWQVNAVISPADRPSPGWLALRGLGGWTANITLSSPLYLLPAAAAAPLALLPLLGWAGWKSELGQTGFLLCAGYGLAFMIAGRDANFYWALIVMPVWFIGLAFLPRAILSLWYAARWS